MSSSGAISRRLISWRFVFCPRERLPAAERL
jgi:hypothetical protein